MLSDEQLLELAGKPAFGRGRAYRDEGCVHLSVQTSDALKGEVLGSEPYALWLRRDGAQWRWSCTCPAADGGAFCKHLVAAVLAARDGNGRDTAARPDAGLRDARTPADDLQEFLRAQPAERLAGWLKSLADGDPEIDKRLRLYRAADDPAALKAALAKLLSPGGFLDQRGSLRYARRLGAVIEQMQALLARDPQECRVLCEYVLGRLLRIYMRSDDSAGAIGDCLQTIAQLHARACTVAPPGKALAKALFSLQQLDDWNMLPLDAYWAALGSDGQHAYEKLIANELARLFAKPGATGRYGEDANARRRIEAYARCAGDFDLLQRVLRRDLSHPYDHLRVIESLHEFGREREALAFAEAAVKQFPRDARLRQALSDCLQAAGLADEAIEQSWQSFVLSPDFASWDALKRVSEGAWPQWRARALVELAARDSVGADLYLRLLLHDGDISAAVALAREQSVWPSTLHELAGRIAFEMPDVAAEFYLRLAMELSSQALAPANYEKLVGWLLRASRLAPAATWRPAVAAVRAAHARKPRLIALLDAANLPR